MNISALSGCSFQSRGLIPARLTVHRYLSCNKCRIRKRLFQHSQIGNVSRKFSVNSLTNYYSEIMASVVDSNALILTQNFFMSFHDSIGLPWWCVVVTSAAILKISFLPVSIYQLKLRERYSLIGQQLQDVRKRKSYDIYEKSRFYQWDQRKTEMALKKELYLERRKLIIKNNCSPVRTILIGYLELPAWAVLTIMWRTSSYGFSSDITTSKMLLSQFMTEGPIWCSNLTLPDPYYIIPALVMLSRLCHVELMKVNNQLLGGKTTIINKILFYISRAFAVILSFSACFMPASVGLFWVSSTAFSCVKIMVLASRKVRQFSGLSYRSFSPKDILEGFKNNILTILKIKNKKL